MVNNIMLYIGNFVRFEREKEKSSPAKQNKNKQHLTMIHADVRNHISLYRIHFWIRQMDERKSSKTSKS